MSNFQDIGALCAAQSEPQLAGNTCLFGSPAILNRAPLRVERKQRPIQMAAV